MTTFEQCAIAYIQYRARVPRPPKPRKYKVWTPSRDYFMRLLAQAGYTTTEIAKVLELTPEQVCSHAEYKQIHTGKRGRPPKDIRLRKGAKRINSFI